MAEEATEKKGGGSAKGAVIGLLLATLIAAGAGAGLGFVLGPQFAAAERKKARPAEGEGEEFAVAEAYGRTSVLRRLKPVMTNLREPFNSWVRLEGALIVNGRSEKGLDEMAALVEQDILAYLRTLALKDLEGPSNLACLRDDLNERARVRTDGKVREFVIVTLVVE